MIAVSDIQHDGKLISAGSNIKSGTFSDEQMTALKIAGAVVDKSEGLAPQDREAKIAALRAELAELDADTGVTPATPGNAAEQLGKDDAIAKLVASGKSHEEATKQVEANVKKAAEAAAKQNQ